MPNAPLHPPAAPVTAVPPAAAHRPAAASWLERWRCARRERAALRELAALDERELRDLGLARGDLHCIAAGGTVR